MSRHLPSLNAIRVFEAAARHLSLVKAAEELHVTHGAVSRQIKQLEENLGLELFERRNRAIFLTRAGLSLQGTCTDIMRQLEAGLRQLRQTDDQPLVVSCEPTIAMRWLIPRLGKFRQLHPELEIHLFAAGGPVDLRHGHIDLALRRNDFVWDANYHAAKVARELIAPVCTSGLLKQGKLQLNQQCLLHTASRPDAWPQWQKLSRQTARSKSRATYEHFYLSLQAACAGLGVVMASAYMVEDEIRSGQLIAPHAFMEDGTDYVLLSALPFDEDPRRRAFLGWLQQELEVTAQAVTGAFSKMQ
ncbi:LysR family transcriptional regulator [Undibacterium sp. YM2]|uniref:LysR substrate-binding domain-containing protein n=1 Tax=Undibacterium sp. YM2 TaxID=2058625 RepID=UPI001331CD39|nr:LysR substrate-binding domain-containing protein [Undibacterium sp. YM2]BBB68944.1 LysR family transcriptional regulator [Undibacterium sp. YM2]